MNNAQQASAGDGSLPDLIFASKIEGLRVACDFTGFNYKP
jgi:hypothetical protein